MSSTNRGGKRIENDAYYTPAWCVHRFLEAYDLSGVWVEPCVGKGSIVEAVNAVKHDVTWITNDLVPTPYSQFTDDARKLKIHPSANVVLSNFPFSCAQEILKNCLKYPALTIVLQRLNWCEGPRSDLFRKVKPSV